MAQTGSADAGTQDGSGDVTVIKAATAGMPKPYVYQDENGNLTGYDIEVLRAVFDQLPQYKLEFQTAEFASLFSGLDAGTYDMVVNNISYQKKRAEIYYYSLPYGVTSNVFIQKEDDKPLTSLADAAERGYKIESDAGSNVSNAIEAWNVENPDKQITLTYSDADLSVWFEHIVDGTSDFRIDDKPIFDTYKKDFGFKLQGTPLPEDVSEQIFTADLSAYFLFPMTDQGAALRDEIDQVLVKLQEDGTLKKLSEQFFGADHSPDASKMEKTVN